MKIDPSFLIYHSGPVPSLPMIYDEIKKELNDPSCSAVTIGNVISKDTGLAARLLQIANSSLFGFPSKLDTIFQAIVVIGFQQIGDLILGKSVVRSFSGISEDLVNMDSFWRHSIGCGVAARVLATYQRVSNVERYFVAGLLHDIGRLIIYMKIADLGHTALTQSRSNNELLYQTEEKLLGFNHADVGGKLLEYWKLPSGLVDAVLFHHAPQNSKNHVTESAMIHVADIIANAMQLGSSGEKFVPPLVEEAWEKLGLEMSVLAPALKQIDRQFNDAVEMFLH